MRNCLFWAISSFVTMFTNSHLLQRSQKASIWRKGLGKGLRKCRKIQNIQNMLMFLCECWPLDHVWLKPLIPFPHTANLQQTTLKMSIKIMENFYNCRYKYCMKKGWKHCGKRRNCSSWAISPFVSIFQKLSDADASKRCERVIDQSSVLQNILQCQLYFITFL